MSVHPSENGASAESCSSRRKRLLLRNHRERMSLPLLQPAPLVSVIVLNLNGADILPRCLEAILAQEYPSFEIIVVDNASSDKSLAVLERYREKASHVSCVTGMEVVAESKNLGVAGARNKAVTYAKGGILAFVDNDGYADPHWLRELVATFQSDNRIGAVASTVFFSAAPLKLNGAGGRIFSDGTARDIFFDETLDAQQFPQAVAFPMGCGMALRSELATGKGVLGVFPIEARLPKWFDDVEIGLKVWASGFCVAVAPGAIVLHDFHTTDAIITPKGWQQQLMFEKARVRIVFRFFTLQPLVEVLYRDARKIVRLVTSMHWKQMPALCCAYFWNFLLLPSLFTFRRRWKLDAEILQALQRGEEAAARQMLCDDTCGEAAKSKG